jgi:FkbM family methyltransferase
MLGNELLGNNPLTIVDVGASGGVDLRWHNFTTFFKGVLFEPDPREYDRLKHSGRNDLIILNAALLDSVSEIDFHLCRKQQVSSVYLPNFNILNRFYDRERFEVLKTIRLKTDTLDNQLRNNGILEIDFIKIDTQGSELSVLKGSTDSLKNAIGLEVEVEFVDLYEKQPLFSEVDSFVRKFGFELFDIKRYYWKRNNSKSFGSRKGQLVCGDALYFRSPEEVLIMNDITQEKLIRSICVYLVYGYTDLAQTLFDIARKEGKLSADIHNSIRLIIAKFTEVNLIPNFKGKGRIQKVIQGIANIFSIKGPYAGTDESLGNP